MKAGESSQAAGNAGVQEVAVDSLRIPLPPSELLEQLLHTVVALTGRDRPQRCGSRARGGWFARFVHAAFGKRLMSKLGRSG
jgi:predicted esterase YcpF (UPF0227 family)